MFVNRNPFFMIDAYTESITDIKYHFIDRKEEMNMCIDALVNHKQNIFLYGERGVGKSFLVRVLEDRINDSSPKIYVFNYRLSHIFDRITEGEVNIFSQNLLLQLSAHIWTYTLGHDYTELRECLLESGSEIKFRSNSEKVLIRIYKLLMINEQTVKRGIINKVGVTVGINAERDEDSEKSIKISEIRPFECALFADEILEKVLKQMGYERLLIFCDEANTLPYYQQELFYKQFQLLFRTNAQFLFVAGLLFGQVNTFIPPSCIDTVIELKGFTKIDYIKALVHKIDPGIELSNDVFDVVFDAFSGNPRKTLYAFAKIYEKYFLYNHEISRGDALIVCSEMQAEYEKDAEKIKKQRSEDQ